MRHGQHRPAAVRAHDLRRTIERLQAYETTDDRLVSVYIPEATPIHEAAARLTRAYARAEDIATATTRTATTDALGSLRDRLQDYKTPPSNGMALFGGIIDDNEVVDAIECPPTPISDLRVERGTTFSLGPAVDLLPDPTVQRDRTLLAELLARREDETAVIGFAPTRRNLEAGAVDRLLVAETFHDDVVSYECPKGHTTRRVLARDREPPAEDCPECDVMIPASASERETAALHLCRLARRHDTDIAFVSTDVEGGDQLATEGDVGGLLRYRTGL